MTHSVTAFVLQNSFLMSTWPYPGQDVELAERTCLSGYQPAIDATLVKGVAAIRVETAFLEWEHRHSYLSAYTFTTHASFKYWVNQNTGTGRVPFGLLCQTLCHYIEEREDGAQKVSETHIQTVNQLTRLTDKQTDRQTRRERKWKREDEWEITMNMGTQGCPYLQGSVRIVSPISRSSMQIAHVTWSPSYCHQSKEEQSHSQPKHVDFS